MSQNQMSQMGQQSQTNRGNRPNFAGITNGPNGGSVEMRYNTLTNAERPSNVPSTWQNKNEIENEIVQRDELRYDTRTNAEREVEEQREQERRKVLPIGRYHPNMLSMRPCGSKERPCDPVRREDTKDFGMLTEPEERRQKQQFVQPNQQTQGDYLGHQERPERLDRPEHLSRPENLEPPEHPIYGGERVYVHPKDRNVPLGLPVDYRDYDITAVHANHPNHPNHQNHLNHQTDREYHPYDQEKKYPHSFFPYFNPNVMSQSSILIVCIVLMLVIGLSVYAIHKCRELDKRRFIKFEFVRPQRDEDTHSFPLTRRFEVNPL